MITRLLAVARITFLELIRSRSLWVIALIVLVQGITLYFMRETNEEARRRTLQGTTLLAVNVFGLLGALVLAGGTIPRDLERRHLYFVFVKPLRNWEFLVGKTFGVWAVLLVITAAAAGSLFTVLAVTDGPGQVRARARAAQITSTTEGFLNGSDLQLPINTVTPMGTWILPEDIVRATSVSWRVPGLMPGSRTPGRYAWIHGERAVPVTPEIEPGVLRLPVPAGGHSWRLRVGRRSSSTEGAIGMIAGANRVPVRLVSESVDPDFSEGGAALVVDLKSLMPGSNWGLEVQCRGQKTRRSIRSRELHRIDLPPPVGPEDAVEMSIRLVGGNRAGFAVHPKRVWVEGRRHPLIDNVVRGFGIAWLHLSAVSAVALISSVFLTMPTSMLIGFTFFILSHSLGTLRQIPEILFHGGALRAGQELPEHVTSETSFRLLKGFVDGMSTVLPDFARFSPGEFFQRGEHIAMVAFWSELGGSIVVLACCVVAGSLFVIRKEFLK